MLPLTFRADKDDATATTTAASCGRAQGGWGGRNAVLIRRRHQRVGDAVAEKTCSRCSTSRGVYGASAWTEQGVRVTNFWGVGVEIQVLPACFLSPQSLTKTMTLMTGELGVCECLNATIGCRFARSHILIKTHHLQSIRTVQCFPISPFLEKFSNSLYASNFAENFWEQS